MSEQILQALIGLGGGLLGSVATYAATRESRRRYRKAADQQLTAANISYMESLQTKLQSAGEALETASEEHGRELRELEKRTYIAEENLKWAQLEHERTVRAERQLNSDQYEEIVKYQGEVEVLNVRIRDLRKQMGFIGVDPDGKSS